MRPCNRHVIAIVLGTSAPSDLRRSLPARWKLDHDLLRVRPTTTGRHPFSVLRDCKSTPVAFSIL